MKNKTILLVEDDYLDIESVKRSLKKLNINHTLQVAFNGVSAFAMLASEQNKIIPDIIILDLNLPRMNGLEFLRNVRDFNMLKRLKIFILTTSKEEYDEITAQNLGVTGYILKPLDFENNPSTDTKKLMEELLNEN